LAVTLVAVVPLSVRFPNGGDGGDGGGGDSCVRRRRPAFTSAGDTQPRDVETTESTLRFTTANVPKASAHISPKFSGSCALNV
jgi:hypothetical protein